MEHTARPLTFGGCRWYQQQGPHTYPLADRLSAQKGTAVINSYVILITGAYSCVELIFKHSFLIKNTNSLNSENIIIGGEREREVRGEIVVRGEWW